MDEENRFFTDEQYKNEIHQEMNFDVIKRINNDTSITDDSLILSFYYITDLRSKIDSLDDFISNNMIDYQVIEVNQINDIWELNGRTDRIKIEIDAINNWEQNMWDIGYKFDCKLDGWETLYLNE